jgi:uncharacterized protein (TIGR03000 family)
MLFVRLSPSRSPLVLGVALAAGALLVSATGLFAGGPGYGIPSGSFPWTQAGHQGYNETNLPTETPPTEATHPAPEHYSVEITPLSVKHTHDDPNVAIITANLPDHARLWFDGVLTTQTGTVRYFETPPLTPGKNYIYTARVKWFEKGKWVEQTTKIPVHAGDVQTVYLVRKNKNEAEKK